MLIDWFVETSYMYVRNDACYFDLSSITGLIVPVFSIYIPSALMLIASGMIFKVARKQATQIQAFVHVAQNLNNMDNGVRQKSRKAAKTLGLITGVFLLCWLPLYILMFIAHVFSETETLIPLIVWKLCLWMGYINSMCNPLIYAMCNQSFRKAFKKILCRR